MKPKLTIVTGNPLKFRELSTELSNFFDCEQGSIDGFEIQGQPEEILQYKLTQAFKKFNQPVLVDDTSVHFEELNGFPGPYMRDFLNAFSSYEMGKKFKGGRISVVCRLGIMKNTNDVIIGEGIIHGLVVDPKPVDPGVREFDLFIQVDGTDKPMIEFTPEEKNKFSHRGNAMRDLLKKLA